MKKIVFAVAAIALMFQACGKKEEKTVSGLLRSDFQTVVNGTDSIEIT